MPPKRQYRKKAASKAKAKVPRKYIPKKQSEQNVTKIVNKVLRKKVEVKHKDHAYDHTQLYHDNFIAGSFHSFLIHSNSLTIDQGTASNQRIGRDVQIIGTMLKIMFLIKNDRLNTKFRVMILRHPKDYNIMSNYTQVFDNMTDNLMVDAIDKNRVVVLYDKILGYKNFNPTNSTDEITFFKTIIVPRQKYKLEYLEDGSLYFNNPKFYDSLIICAYDTQGSLITDNIGAVTVNQRTYFTDL